VRCKSCGYDLLDLHEYRCAECGRPFDPAHPGTYLFRPMNGRKSLRAAIMGAVLVIIPQAFSLTVYLAEYFHHESPTGAPIISPMVIAGPGLMVAALAIEAVVLFTSGMALLDRFPWVIHRGAFRASFLISLAVVAWFGGLVVISTLC